MQVVSDFPKIFWLSFSMVYADLVVIVLYWYDYVAVRSEPGAYTAEYIHIGTEAMAENNYFEFFFFVLFIYVKFSIQKCRHFHLS